ncbi:hypothetical protein HDA32_000261 [Spinactinospora alkalitolerans]|uniref:DUF6879 domain-containing protein n=1 Tax=Spinactinospora alkalitolerans TaxID=687207 RepID=A0A852TNX5_9ACTN|nr:DUF6879 family protein [Spinactinospora alkalitolerans]NYE45141.1 hypothetical protein [Spinactinospora alkalitolerans]
MISEKELAKFFSEFRESAFRLETLDHYSVPEESAYFESFLSGGDFPEEWEDNPWVRGMTDQGKILQRVHVLRSPLSDYLRFQLGWGYPGSIVDGEDIRIIDLSESDVQGLPGHDFWIFDDSTVLRMQYSEYGNFKGAVILPESRTSEYRGYRDTALSNAVPYTEYWSRHR